MLDQWQARFPSCEPDQEQLRNTFTRRWVRFHSLPGSKRYPGDESEYATVLARHNLILGELATPGQRLTLLTTGYSSSPEPSRSESIWMELDPSAVPVRTFLMEEAEADFDASYWHVYASERDWYPGKFDELIRLVADDIVANVMIVPADCRWLIHPYDGGMDVIAECEEARDDLKSRHTDWLSLHPCGL